METEILSDERIELLLQEVEARLRSSSKAPVSNHQEAAKEDLAEIQKRKPLPKLKHNLDRPTYIQDKNGVAQTNPSVIATKELKTLAETLRTVEGNKSIKPNDQLTSGPQWFDLPKTVVTPQLKRDLQLIEMRSVLDPHRHYKKNNRKGKLPTFSQVGTVIEGPTEFYSARINKKDRAKNFVEEAMVTESQNGRFKRKYDEIQDTKKSGKKAHYKKLMEKRRRKP